MLGNQLISRSEVTSLVSNHALLTGRQHVKEVVDHDRHVDAINGREHAPMLSARRPAPNCARNPTQVPIR